MTKDASFWRCIECGEVVVAHEHESHEHNEFRMTAKITRHKKQELLQRLE